MDKKKLDPDTNKLQISTRKDARFFMFLSKIFLNKFESVELHGLGEAINLCVRVSENLQRFGYCSISKVETFSFSPSETEGKNDTETGENENPARKKVKMIVTLKRSNDFFEKVQNIAK